MSDVSPALPLMRYAYQPPLGILWLAATTVTTARIPFLQIILPLSLIMLLFSDGPHCIVSREHNELFHARTYRARVLLPFFPVSLPRARCIRRFIQRAARPINISARTFACKSRRRGENGDASRNELAHTRTLFYKRNTSSATTKGLIKKIDVSLGAMFLWERIIGEEGKFTAMLLAHFIVFSIKQFVK